MADISKIKVNSTTYNLKDSRIPALNSSTTQFLRGDGTWATPTVSEITSTADVTDDGTGMIIEPSGGGGGGTYQAKSNINPTTSSQTITPDSGYDALSSVQINAMPSGSASTPATTITANPTISVSSGGLITASVSGSQSVTPSVSAGYVASGTAGTVSVSGSNTSQLATFPTTIITPETADYTIPAERYLTGTVKVLGDTNLVAANIADGKTIFNVTGSHKGYTLLGSTDLTTSTTSTSASSAGQLTVSGAWTKAKMIYVRIRDKAGPRAGYFYGSDNFFINYQAGNDSTTSLTYGGRIIHRYSTSSVWGQYSGATTTGYGVYVYDINTSGRVRIYQRYNSNYSLTVNGTYHIEVYTLDWPDGVGIYH